MAKSNRLGRLGDLMIVGNRDPHPRARRWYWALRVQGPGGKEAAILLTDHELKRALRRARRNPEDVPKARNLVDKIRDLLD